MYCSEFHNIRHVFAVWDCLGYMATQGISSDIVMRLEILLMQCEVMPRCAPSIRDN